MTTFTFIVLVYESFSKNVSNLQKLFRRSKRITTFEGHTSNRGYTDPLQGVFGPSSL